jgi:hypothetical protein
MRSARVLRTVQISFGLFIVNNLLHSGADAAFVVATSVQDQKRNMIPPTLFSDAKIFAKH